MAVTCADERGHSSGWSVGAGQVGGDAGGWVVEESFPSAAGSAGELAGDLGGHRDRPGRAVEGGGPVVHPELRGHGHGQVGQGLGRRRQAHLGGVGVRGLVVGGRAGGAAMCRP